MIVSLRWVTGALCLAMISIIVMTSLESNLFEVWGELIQIPWMVATLADFYMNVAVIYLWIFYRERSWWARITWLILMICLGSIATMSYLFLVLMKMDPEDDLAALFRRERGGPA